MSRIVIVMAMLLTAVALSACKFESMSMFDNNCSRNGGMYNEAHCANFGV